MIDFKLIHRKLPLGSFIENGAEVDGMAARLGEFRDQLTSLASAGWELIHVIDRGDNVIVIFRREV
jgi:hypothetical protein